MFDRLARWGIVALVLLVLPMLQVPGAQVAAQEIDCSAADAYVVDLKDAAAQLEALFTSFDDSEVGNWTSEEFAAASAAIAAVSASLEEIVPPPVAETFHTLLLTQVGLLGQMFDTMATAGVFGALAYAEQMDKLSDELETAAADFEAVCGVDLMDALEEAAAGATPVALDDDDTDDAVSDASLGTRENPIPMGETVQIDDDWEMTVVAVEPDATDTILAADSFAEPPAPGHQFFVATIRVTYIGDGSEEFYSGNLRAVGQMAVAYRQFDDSCGWSIPNALEDRELFSGGTIEGNLCWSIDSADADSLVLYDGDERGDDRIYFSLMPSADAGMPATPVPDADAKRN